jgi:NAD+ kinase
MAHARVGLILKRDKPEALALARDLGGWLRARGVAVAIAARPGATAEVDGCESVPEERLASAVDLVVVLGGDGTLLHASSLVSDHGIPLLGVNLGRLGFLATCAPADAQATLETALSGQLALDERMRLRSVVRRARSGETVERSASNDVVVSLGALARLIELETWQVHNEGGGEATLVNRYRSDGLIIATPTGSTAYNLAAGGPIVTPDVQAMVVTPICSHALSSRPVVIPASSRLRIRLGQPAQDVIVTVDGQWGTGLGVGDALEVSVHPKPLRLFRPIESYFDVLRRKMGWE